MLVSGIETFLGTHLPLWDHHILRLSALDSAPVRVNGDREPKAAGAYPGRAAMAAWGTD